MNTNYLKEYLVIAQELNYSSAAKKLFISRPTLTSHLRELEEELGCNLVKRDRGRVELTPAGVHFVTTATEVLNAADEVIEEYRCLADNLLTVTVSSTNLPWIETILYQARRNIQEKFPYKKIEIITESGPSSTIEALEKGINDIVVAGYKSYMTDPKATNPPEGIRGIKLNTEEIKLLMTQDHPFFNKETINAKDIDGMTLMLPPDLYGSYLRDQVPDKFLEKGAKITLQTLQFGDHFEYFSYDFKSTIGIVPSTLIPRFGIDCRSEYRAFSLVDLPLFTHFSLYFKEEFAQSENGGLLISEIERLITREQ